MRRWGCCCRLQKSCVRAQVTLHTAPPGSLCSPPLPGSRDPGTTSPGECTARLRLVQHHAGLGCRRLAPPPLYPSLPAAWVSQSPRSSCSFNHVLSGRGTDTLRRPTRRGGSKSKADPQELCKQRREEEISPSSLRSSGLKLHKQLDVPASVEHLNRQRIIPDSGGGLWEQEILIFPLFLFLRVYMYMLLGEILSVELCFIIALFYFTIL